MTERTLLLRQVHPTFVQAGRVTSQAFRPTPKDEYCLSVYDGDLIEADTSWMHYTDSLGFQSAGAMAISVAECIQHNLPAAPDPEPFPEHAVVDFRQCISQVEKKSKQLRTTAERRGWLFQPS